MKEYRISIVSDGNGKSHYEVEWKRNKSSWFSGDEWYTAVENERIGETGWHINVKQEFKSLEEASTYVRSKDTTKETVVTGKINNA
jgi:hypothetical protein